jgi:hypothetical protein
VLPKTPMAGGKSAFQQIYGRRDVGVSYQSDLNVGQRLPTMQDYRKFFENKTDKPFFAQ